MKNINVERIRRKGMKRRSPRALSFPRQQPRQKFIRQLPPQPVFDRGVIGPRALAEFEAADLVFTPIPKGIDWTVKVLGKGSVVSAVGTYPSRAEAMRMASRLADAHGGRAMV